MTSLYRVLLGNLSKLGFSLGISMALGLILKSYMPRVLGVENIGVFYHADSISHIFFTLLPLGIHTFINRVIPPAPEKVNEIFSSIIWFMMVYGLCLWMILWGYASILEYDGLHLQIILLIGGYQFSNFFTNEVLKPIFIASDKVDFVSRMDIIHKACQVGGICVGLFFFPSIIAAAYLYLATQTLSLGIYLFKSLRLGWMKGGFSFIHCRNFILLGLPFFLNNALLSFYGNIDVAMLERFSSHAEVGWYGASQQLKGIFMMVVPLLYTVIMPLLSKVHARSRDEFEDFAGNIYRLLIYCSWLLALTMASFSQEFVQILFGSEFLPATNAVVLLAPVLLFTYMNVFLSMILNLVSSGKGMVLVTSGSLVANAGLNLIFIPWGLAMWSQGGGGVGASMTTIVAEILVFVCLLKLTPLRLMTLKNGLSSFYSFMIVSGLIIYLLWVPRTIVQRGLIFALCMALTLILATSTNWKDLKRWKNLLWP